MARSAYWRCSPGATSRDHRGTRTAPTRADRGAVAAGPAIRARRRVPLRRGVAMRRLQDPGAGRRGAGHGRDARRADSEEIDAGWRLGCLADSHSAVTLEIAQWSIAVLEDHAELPFEPAEGFGTVVDVGTTTLVAQLVDRSTGSVLKLETVLNPQARFGADLMSRIHHDLAEPGTMTAMIREAVGGMLGRRCEERPLEETFLVGNTAMHHFFSGISVEPLAAVPFRSPELGPRHFEARELGWSLRLRQPACFLPCVGGFVGSDLLAGLVATGLFEIPRAGRSARPRHQWRDRRWLPGPDTLRLDSGRTGVRRRADRLRHACRRRGHRRRVHCGRGAGMLGDWRWSPAQGSAAAAWWTPRPRPSSSAGSHPAAA